MSNVYLVLALAALVVFVSMACKVSQILREQRTTNDLLRELLKSQ